MTTRLTAWVAALALIAAQAGAQALPFAPGEDPRFDWAGYAAFADAHDFGGETLTIAGPWTGPDAALFRGVLAYFAAATGAELRYSGSDSFEQDIVIATRAGTAPNVAIFPQPGLAADIAARGHLAPLGEATADWLRANYAAGQSWVDLARFAGPDGRPELYGFVYKVELKSLVWFNPERFDEAGYAPPRSMEELIALSERIVAEGGTPWCIGLGSGAATGWPATDWVEDILLRSAPPEVYDDWVANALPFDDPRIVAAMALYARFARSPGWAAGGAQAVATTDFRDAPAGLFTLPPRCYMHRQASFIQTYFPEGAVHGRDYGFFPFPPFAEGETGLPVLGSGTLVAITRDSPAARGLIAFLKLPLAHEVWMAQSGFLTPHLGANPETFASAALREMNAILLGADTFRFDASDLMPGEIGAGAFWTGMVEVTTGADPARVAAAIQARRDAMR